MFFTSCIDNTNTNNVKKADFASICYKAYDDNPYIVYDKEIGYADNDKLVSVDSTTGVQSIISLKNELSVAINTCNMLKDMLQDTASHKSQASTMNVTMAAGKKIKDVDISQYNTMGQENFATMYQRVNLLSKVLTTNIARFNTTFNTHINSIYVEYENNKFVLKIDETTLAGL